MTDTSGFSKKIKVLIASVLVFIFLSGFALFQRLSFDESADCEIAFAWFEQAAIDSETFDEFLEKTFRMGMPIQAGGFFRKTRHSIAIIVPLFDRAKSIDFLFTNDGKALSINSVSISKESWTQHQKITCAQISRSERLS